MFELATMLWLVPGLPLAAAILTGLLGPVFFKRWSHLPTIVASAGSCVASALLVVGMIGYTGAINAPGYTWFAAGALKVTFGLQADTLTLVMLLTITFVG